jgi:Tfp pilus assembly protein PilF
MSRRDKKRAVAQQSAPTTPLPNASASAPSSRATPAEKRSSGRAAVHDGFICLLLIAAVFTVYGQTARNTFINFDDDEYVKENREVRDGLTLHGLRSAFMRPLAVNWHPLTTLSHMLDCQLYGLWVGGHHLTSVMLHAITAAALYLVLRQMTGLAARSAFSALLFSLHPLRVESVAWVAERKDVLSGLFFVLTLAAYLCHVRKPASVFRMLLLPCVFALGLMCKPMLVTVPLVLLLLDYWPLGRFAIRSGETDQSVPSRAGTAGSAASPVPASRLLLEKLPLFILSACSCAITLLLQASAIPNSDKFNLAQRFGNCLLAYAGYLKLFFWPFRLAVYYPYSEAAPSPLSLIAAAAVLVGMSYLAWIWRLKRPYLIVGWLWYLLMLLPVIGLVQVGNQSMADRYTYLPMIGPAMALVWLIADLVGSSLNRRFAASIAGSLAVLVLAGIAARQTAFWRDDRTLWTHTLECTKDNYVARLHLGLAWSENGHADKAIEQYNEALRIRPDFCEARFDLASTLNSVGQIDAAQEQYEIVLKIRPEYAKARNNFGMLLLDRGNIPAAAEQFQKALDVDPRYALARNNLGLTLMATGQNAAAADCFRHAIELDSGFPQPHANLGLVLGRMGQSTEAVAELNTFLRVQPDNAKALSWLAWVLATARDDAVRDGRRAVELARRAAELSHGSDPRILDALSAAYAETRDFPAAIETARAASDLAEKSGQTELAEDIRRRLELYRHSQPFRQ